MNGRPLALSDDQRRLVCDVLRRHVPDARAIVFGSRAAGRARRYSDLDLAIDDSSPLDLVVYAALVDDLRESDLPFKVDVVDLRTASESFRAIVARDGVVLG